ncbi:MAG: ATP-binding protein, partial [Candidatus Altiarchaeota archaeon]
MGSWVEKPLAEITTTEDIKVPEDILNQVIGQDAAIKKVKLAITQRRHLLLVGPPGIGKSMMAQALARHLPKPKEQINILHNPQNQSRPLVEVITEEVHEKVVSPQKVPSFVAEQLGFKCPKCGAHGSPDDTVCKKCGASKFKHITQKREIQTTCFGATGQEIDVIYIREKSKVKVVDHAKQKFDTKMQKLRFRLIPLTRKTFVHATGASETELLGDVRHDPYGSHPEIGTPAYLRVVPGAIHEAHEG